MYSIELLQAISDWQRGGDEKLKTKRGIKLKIAAQNLPIEFRSIDSNCYRKLSLDKKSVWNVGTKYELEETISAWTTSFEVSKEFKGGVPPVGYQGVIFEISPTDEHQVIINLDVLFQCNKFKKYVEENRAKVANFDKGMGRYGDSQNEVIIESQFLKLDSIKAFGGYSAPESELAKMYYDHEASEVELNKFRILMEQAGHKCGPYWLSTEEAVKRVSEKLKFHGNRLSVLKRKGEIA
jgi:hypothetical protein